jgi:hypothetical protein
MKYLFKSLLTTTLLTLPLNFAAQALPGLTTPKKKQDHPSLAQVSLTDDLRRSFERVGATFSKASKRKILRRLHYHVRGFKRIR